MGSNQSSTPDSSSSPTLPVLPRKETDSAADISKHESQKKSRKPPPNLSGTALVEYKCRKKKKAYTKCVAGWYNNRFLQAKALEQEGDCDDLFESFRQCYMRGMLKERQKKGLDAPREGTILAEFIDEEDIEFE